MISKKRYQDAEKFFQQAKNKDSKVISKDAVTKHMGYLLQHISFLETELKNKS